MKKKPTPKARTTAFGRIALRVEDDVYVASFAPEAHTLDGAFPIAMVTMLAARHEKVRQAFAALAKAAFEAMVTDFLKDQGMPAAEEISFGDVCRAMDDVAGNA